MESVICLAGPTGCGKTAVSLKIAANLGCEIVNADSRQVYRDFPVITAQPSPAERAGIPHHLYGYLESGQKTSAGEWLALALKICRGISSRGKIPLLVGGTGLYFDALLKGISNIPRVAPEISAGYDRRMREDGPAKLYAELEKADPQYAAKIHPNDRQRIQRALEVLAATGRPFSWWHKNAPPLAAAKGPLFALETTLAALEPRLLARIDAMLANGAVEEARAGLRKCADKDAPAWSGIGCAELRASLAGEIDLEECKRLWFANTRAYAKRQLTWFRGRKNAIWLKPADAAEKIINYWRKASWDAA